MVIEIGRWSIIPRLPWFIITCAALGWTARRLRGSEMNKHWGKQLWSPLVALVAVILLSGCESGDTGRYRVNSRPVNAANTAAPVETPAVSLIDATPSVPVLVATERPPCANGVIPAKVPDWPAYPTCEAGMMDGYGRKVIGCHNPDLSAPATCPCATKKQIDAILQTAPPWICPEDAR